MKGIAVEILLPREQARVMDFEWFQELVRGKLEAVTPNALVHLIETETVRGLMIRRRFEAYDCEVRVIVGTDLPRWCAAFQAGNVERVSESGLRKTFTFWVPDEMLDPVTE